MAHPLQINEATCHHLADLLQMLEEASCEISRMQADSEHFQSMQAPTIEWVQETTIKSEKMEEV